MYKNHYHIKLAIILFFFSLFLFSCAESDKTVNQIDKILLQNENVKIYDIDLEKMLKAENIYKRLHEFPFIAEDANLDFKGHFPIEFYQSFKFKIVAKELKDVDFWKLKMYPYSVDVIYVKPIWVENFKKASNDLFEDICYSYNISKREQEILLWWLKNGGVLWIESGLYATGFENIKRDGTINLKAIKKRIVKLTSNLHFLEFPVKTISYIFPKRPLTAINMRTVVFDNLTIKAKFLKDINQLKLKIRYPVQTFFTIPVNPVITNRKGLALLTIKKYYEGKIIFILPFDYLDAYKDGELLRWKLLEYLYYKPHYTAPKSKDKKKNNSKKILKKSIKKKKKKNFQKKKIELLEI